MKKNDWEKLKDQSTRELQTLVTRLGKEIGELKMQLALGKLKDVHAIHKKRKDMAQIKTLFAEREFLEEQKPAEK